MSREVIAYIDHVVDASMAPAAKAMAPVVRAVQDAVEAGAVIETSALLRAALALLQAPRSPGRGISGRIER